MSRESKRVIDLRSVSMKPSARKIKSFPFSVPCVKKLIAYDQLKHVTLPTAFLNNPQLFLRHLW